MRIEMPTSEIMGQTDFKMAPTTRTSDFMPLCNFLDPWMWAGPVICFQPREYSKGDSTSLPWLRYIDSDFPLASRCYPCWLWWNKQPSWGGPYDKGLKTASSQQLTGNWWWLLLDSQWVTETLSLATGKDLNLASNNVLEADSFPVEPSDKNPALDCNLAENPTLPGLLTHRNWKIIRVLF